MASRQVFSSHSFMVQAVAAPLGEEVSSEKWRSFDRTEMQVHRLGVALLIAQG